VKRRRTDGVRHLQDVLDRCEVDDETGCWHWLGAMSTKRNGSRTPHVDVAPGVIGPHRVSTSGARVAWLLSGRKVAKGQNVWRTCGCSDCCNPQHGKAGTKAEEGAWFAASGLLKGHPHRAAAGKRAAAGRVVPPEKVARVLELVESGAPVAQIVADVGLHKGTISRIRNNRHASQRPPIISGASVFAWRPAA
jgi:hypothetical protein